MVDRQEQARAAHAFLQALFGDACDATHRVVCWSLPSKATAGFSDLERAARVMVESQGDAYFGACLFSGDRRLAADAVLMPGVWADVDCAGEGKEKHAYPPGPSDAMVVLQGLPEPTLGVNTGGGVHLWWLFDQPIEPRVELVRGFQAEIRRRFTEKGWELDYTHDLARVLRAPGTVNRKYGIDVVAWPQSGPRHAPSVFEEWADQATPEENGIAAGEVSDLLAGWDVSVGAGALSPKVRALMDMDARFASTWAGRRKELEGDQSRYDLALASQMVATGGFSDQEIVDALVLHRLLQKGDEAKRPDYYARTLLKARGGAEQAAKTEARDAQVQERVDAVERAVERVEAPGAAEDPSVALEGLGALSAALGVHITVVELWQGAGSFYRMVLEGADVPWVDVVDPTSYAEVRRRLGHAKVYLPDHVKMKKWGPVCRLILQLAVPRRVPGSSEALGLVEEVLRGYAEDEDSFLEEGVASMTAGSVSCVRDGKPLVSLDSLMSWLGSSWRGDAPGRREMMRLLRSAGGTPKAVNLRNPDGGTRQRRLWVGLGGLLDGMALMGAGKKPKTKSD